MEAHLGRVAMSLHKPARRHAPHVALFSSELGGSNARVAPGKPPVVQHPQPNQITECKTWGGDCKEGQCTFAGQSRDWSCVEPIANPE
jgi:hypothetical protein